MAAFYGWGPRTEVEVGETECVYGRWGHIGRAARDVPSLATGPIGVVLVSLTIGLAAAFVIAGDASPAIKVLGVLAAVVGGLAAAALLLWLWSAYWPTAWKRHWVMRFGTPGGMYAHSLLSLHSKHHHRIINLRCVVRDPAGAEWHQYWRRAPEHILKPGESVAITYPRDFGNPPPAYAGDNSKVAPYPERGVYCVRWETNVLEGTKPRVLAKRKWRVE